MIRYYVEILWFLLSVNDFAGIFWGENHYLTFLWDKKDNDRIVARK